VRLLAFASCMFAVTAGGGELGVRVADLSEECCAGLRAELGQQLVAAVSGGQLRHPALGVVQVAEGDRRRRASRLTSRDDVSVAQLTLLAPRGNACTLHALNAVRALLHDTAHAHRDV